MDKDTNILSLLEVSEQITSLEPITEPGRIPVPMQMVTLWARDPVTDPTDGRARTRLLSPQGNQLGPDNEYRVDLTSFERLRHRLAFPSLRVTTEGQYEFVTEVNEKDGSWREVARVPFSIKVAEEETRGE